MYGKSRYQNGISLGDGVWRDASSKSISRHRAARLRQAW